MAGEEVAMKKTPVSLQELIVAFVNSWRKLTGTEPSREQIAMLVSHNSLETGGFTGKSMYNYNIGFITKTPQDSFDYFLHPDSYHGKKFMSKFRSYNTLEDGVADYIKLIKRGYPQAFTAINEGPKEFAYALVADPKFKYYDETHRDEYATGVSKWYKTYLNNKDFNEYYNNAIHKSGEAPKDEEGEGLFAKIEHFLEKLFGFASNENKFLIIVNANDTASSVEFARLLSLAVEEEIQAKTNIYKNNKSVELECSFNGNQKIAEAALKQLVDVLSENFFDATRHIGGIKVNTLIVKNANSKYNKIENIDTYFRQFHLKFIKNKK